MWWLFVVSALIELAAGAASLFSPSSIPAFNKVCPLLSRARPLETFVDDLINQFNRLTPRFCQLTTGQGAEAVRWWSVAVISLGAAAFLVRNGETIGPSPFFHLPTSLP